jgi:hypothetical protein
VPIRLDTAATRDRLPGLDDDVYTTLATEFVVYGLGSHSGPTVWKHTDPVRSYAVSPAAAAAVAAATAIKEKADAVNAKRKAMAPPANSTAAAKRRRLAAAKKAKGKQRAVPTPPVPVKKMYGRDRVAPKRDREIVLVTKPHGTAKIVMPDGSRIVKHTRAVGWLWPTSQGHTADDTLASDRATTIVRKAYDDIRPLDTLVRWARAATTFVSPHPEHPAVVSALKTLLPLNDTVAHNDWFKSLLVVGITAIVHGSALDMSEVAANLLRLVPCIPMLHTLLNLVESAGENTLFGVLGGASARQHVPAKTPWRMLRDRDEHDEALRIMGSPPEESRAKTPFIVCDDIMSTTSGVTTWLLRSRSAYMSRGKAYVPIKAVYTGEFDARSPLGSIVAIYLTRLVCVAPFTRLVMAMCPSKPQSPDTTPSSSGGSSSAASSASSEDGFGHPIRRHALRQHEELLYDMVIEVAEAWHQTLADIDTRYENAPPCVRALMEDNVPLLDKHRYQLAAVVARAAKNWSVPSAVLAAPFLEMIKTSSVNRDRLLEFTKDLDHQSQKPKDARPCVTRRGPYAAKSELTCPFRTGGRNHVMACRATRRDPADGKGRPFNANTVTISQMWTHSMAK